MTFKKLIIVMAALGIFLPLSCGTIVLPPRAAIDTPLYHVKNGMIFLRFAKMEDAFREFTRAKELDHEYSPAYVGLGIFFGFKGDFEKGHENLKIAGRYAKGKEQTAGLHIGLMRFFILGKEALSQNWLTRVEKEFENVKALTPDSPESFYHMGLAYKISGKFEEAVQQFDRVMELKAEYATEAAREKEAVLAMKTEKPG